MLKWLTHSVAPAKRIRNEMNQLYSIRDDAIRCDPGSPMHAWLGGAIFTLSWILGEPGAISPSQCAHQELVKSPAVGKR